MQSQNFTELLSGVFKPENLFDKMEKLAAKNEKDLGGKEVPQKGGDFLRTPTAAELLEMRQWADKYKKDNPIASKREVRKATQNQFNVRIFRASYKKRS